MIGQETIERVRQQASLVAVVEESVRLQRRGRSLLGLCPFHKEKTPSFHVNPERGFYHCFGCGVSGDAIRFVQETQGLSFIEAVRELAERFGVPIVEVGTEAERRTQNELRRRQTEFYDVSNAAAAFFEQTLRQHPLCGYAQSELARRGLVADSPTGSIANALQAFRVGYAPLGWDELTKHLRTLGMSHAAAEAVGLIVPRKNRPGHYDRFRHRLMFAIMDPQGRVIAFSGRTLPMPDAAELERLGMNIPSESSSQQAPAKYLNSPESPIYKKREALFGWFQARNHIRESGQAIVVEGNFDVVSLHARGVTNVVAPLGTAFTLEQAHLIRRLAPDVCLLFDGDKAGRRAVRASREAIRESGLGCKVASLPDGIDPDELVRKEGPVGITRTVAAARGLLEYLIDSVLDAGFAADDALAQSARIKEVTDLLAAETDPSVRALATRYADQIAGRLGIADAQTFSALVRRVNSALASSAAPHPPKGTVDSEQSERSSSNRPLSQSDRIGLEILGILLDHPQLLDSSELSESAVFLEGDIAAAVAAAKSTMTGHPVLATEQFLAKLSGPVYEFAASRLAAPLYESLDDARTVLAQNINKLVRLEQVRQKNDAISALRRAAAAGDFQAELALLEQQFSQAQQRHGVGER